MGNQLMFMDNTRSKYKCCVGRVNVNGGLGHAIDFVNAYQSIYGVKS